MPFLKSLPASYSDMKVEKVDYSSSKGKQMVRDYGISFLPAYVFNAKIEQVKDFENFAMDGTLKKTKDSNYVYSSAGRPGIFINRQSIPNLLEIYTDPSQPNATDLIRELIKAKKEGNIYSSVNLQFVPMPPPEMTPGRGASVGITNELTPMGLIAVEEGKRWAYLQKYEGAKFLDYLMLRTENMLSILWEDPAKRAGINPDELTKALINGDAQKLLDEDYNKDKELGFKPGGTTTFVLYENRVLLADPPLLNSFTGFKSANIRTRKPCCGGTTAAAASGVPGANTIAPVSPTPNAPIIPAPTHPVVQ